jgi:hypothetical protein
LIDIAAIVPPEPFIPITFVEVMRIPCPVDERLPADPWAIQSVSGYVEVRNAVGARRHC